MLSPADTSCPVDARTGVVHFGGGWVLATFASLITISVLHRGGTDVDIAIGVLAVSLLVGWAVYVAAMWSASRSAGTGDLFADFGVAVKPIDAIGLIIGVAAQLVLVPLVYFPLRAVWPDVFTEAALTETAEGLVRRADGGLIIVLALAVVIGAPLAEEFFYRGLLQRPLLGELPAAAVIVGVAAVFALIHFRPVEYPGLFAAGLVFGVCAWLTGRLGMSIAAHVGFNAVGVALAVNNTWLSPAIQ